ncbi:pectinesterase family protein [Leeuwenhoekiella sp. H156]|uniref:pectinesterase family protein n=1 Tax=Leeuwenhoekiella sp. H156 TaxID=3450128 RepID=UPI003FA4365A
MHFKTGLGIVFFILATACVAQKRPIEVKPYTINTTYEKLKKDYPFITPIAQLKEGNFNAEENVTYTNVAGKALKADVYYPKNSETNNPAILLVFGGGWISGSKENVRPLAQHFADNGYVAMTADYRLSTEAQYPAAVLDLKEAVRWMRKNAEKYQIDPERIAILGNSAGAQLATLVGATGYSSIYGSQDFDISDAVQAIINVDGIVSFIHPEAEESEIAGQWLGGLKNENPQNWKEASPLEYVDSTTPPTLFINSTMPRFHAGRDDMISILNQHGIYNEVHTIPGTPHSFWLIHPWFEKTLQYSLAFLDRVFKAEKPEIYRNISVAQDGSGDFTKIQEAINSTRDLGPGYVRIHIENGTYNEKITIPAWKRKIALIGEDRDKVIIVNTDYSGLVNQVTGEEFNTFTTATLKVEGRDFYAENLTIQNTWCQKGQAVALHAAGDRSIFKNCKLLGCQDTFYTAGEDNRILVQDSYIEGTTDFIFGQATAFFENCEIKSLSNSYITAASTPAFQQYGYVFSGCNLTASTDVDQVYLGRPWRPYAKTVFLNTRMGSHIRPEGWEVWDGDAMFPHKERSVFYAEYNSMGPGANPDKRVWWSHQLYEKELEQYAKNSVLNGTDAWDFENTLKLFKNKKD